MSAPTRPHYTISPGKPATDPEPQLPLAEQVKRLRVLRIEAEDAEAIARDKRLLFKEATNRISKALSAERWEAYRKGQLVASSYLGAVDQALTWFGAKEAGYGYRAIDANGTVEVQRNGDVVAVLTSKSDIRRSRLLFTHAGVQYTYIGDAVSAVLKDAGYATPETAPAVRLTSTETDASPTFGFRRINEHTNAHSPAAPREAARPTNWRERLHAWWSPSVWDEEAFARAALRRARLDWFFRLFRRRDSAEAKLARANAAAEMLRGR